MRKREVYHLVLIVFMICVAVFGFMYEVFDYGSESDLGVSETKVVFSPQGFCGDGICEDGENEFSCGEDCGEYE